MKYVVGEESHGCATTTVERFVCGECDRWYRRNSWKRRYAFKELLFGHCYKHCRDDCARAVNGECEGCFGSRGRPLSQIKTCERGCRYVPASSVFLQRLLFLPVGSRCIDISGVQISRSNAVTGADDVAQLRNLREIRVPEKGHDSRADKIHSFRFAGLCEYFAMCRAGVAVHFGRRRMLMWGRRRL